ncbi:MAG: ComEC/Rec2 family competence protein [Clostridia bacterium]|nr:ComEC/Rec2 family competence protein [Clostridia bacterium]
MGIFHNKPFALGCFLFIAAVIFGRFIDNPRILVIFGIIAATIFLVICFLFKGIKRNNFGRIIPLIFLTVGLIFSSLFMIHLNCDVYSYKSGGEEREIEFTVLSRKYYSNYLTICEILTEKVDGQAVKIKMMLEAPYALDADRGFKIRASAIISAFENDGAFDEKQYYNSKGIYLKATDVSSDYTVVTENVKTFSMFFEDINQSFSSAFDKNLEEDTSALVDAVFLGNKDGLDDIAKRDFKRAGVYHLLALSGMHLSVLSLMVNKALICFRVRKGKRYMLLSLLMSFYVALTGFSLSVVRSAIMLLATYAAYFMRTRKDSLTSLFFAMVAIIIFSPSSVFDVGLGMSFVATLGIIISAPFSVWFRFHIRKLISKKMRVLMDYLFSSIITSFAAILFTLPFSCFLFGGLSLVGIIATIIISPMISAILFISPLMLIFSKVSLVSFVFSLILDFLSDLIYGIASYFSNISGVYVSLDYPFVKCLIFVFFAFLAVFLIVKIKRKIIVPIFVLVFTAVFSFFEYKAIYDSVLYFDYICMNENEYISLSKNGRNVLIDISDASYSSFYEATENTLERGYKEIDVIVLTHLHKGHKATLLRISRNEMVREIWIPSPINKVERDIALDIIYVAELMQIPVRIYDNKSTFVFFENESLIIKRAYISRSTHPVISLDFFGDIDALYIGSSFLEYDSEIDVRENVFIGTHGPICKKEFEVKVGEGKVNIFVSDSEVSEYIRIYCMGEYPKVIKNTKKATLIK